ncbi:MAG: DUF1993 family protein, partial [Pseudomonadota bacterium]
MSITIYELIVESSLQAVGGLKNVLHKGEQFCEQSELHVDELAKCRLVDDMLPLEFQIRAVVNNSISAAEAALSGIATTPQLKA